ncbi:uncharacterized protein UTRI_10080 [Ustilago trichophora]|uniref:CCHC-type domain-containing protein n=1 Tax=Ustilago trichophora TaxID=86804 RepID=A0A5C3E4E9_9BASI|nr:uncharacterized protein UTRI_10080 [Ustilago trichophora]
MSASPTQAPGAAAFSNGIADYSGDYTDVDAQVWLDHFDRFCLDRKIDDDPIRKARYFKTFMTGAARDWYNALPPATQKDFDALEAAFLAHFGDLIKPKETPASRYQAFLNAVRVKKTAESLRDLAEWRKWLAETLTLATKVTSSYASEPLKASMFWAALPAELKPHLGFMRDTVLESVNACRDLPITVYDEIIAEHDTRHQRDKKVSNELANLARIIDGLRKNNLPTTPPEEKRARFDNASAPNGVQLAHPKSPSVDAATIPQYSFTDDKEGHCQYEEALKKYHQEHPRVTISPPYYWPYPVTPGTEKPGTGECHRCGHRGHMYSNCNSDWPVPQLEQNYRRAYARALQGQGNQ